MRTTTEHTDRKCLKAAADELCAMLQGAQADLDWRSDCVLRLTIAIDDIDPADWLAAQPAAERVLWDARDGSLTAAGIGAADLLTAQGTVAADRVVGRLRRRLTGTTAGARYYGGLRFDDRRTPTAHWKPFKSYRFVLPRFETVRQAGAAILAVNIIPSQDKDHLDSIVAGLRHMAVSHPRDSYKVPQIQSRRDNPNRDTWLTAVREAVRSFQKGDLAKIVLARESRFRFNELLDPVRLMSLLQTNTPGCFHFLMQPSNDTAFLSATPERLYRRTGRAVMTEALAGTRPRGATPEEDEVLGDKLLNSRKEAREHGYVTDHTRAALDVLCRSASGDEQPSLVRLSGVQHMITRLKGRLRDDIDDHDLLTQLHPTPAIGGYPADLAQSRLRRLETFDRGWYAGPVGWIGVDEAEFAVGIRSGLVHGDTLRLYSGAGIVEGSHPDKEWDEVENKISTFLKTVTDR